jgi:hypothetical protein
MTKIAYAADGYTRLRSGWTDENTRFTPGEIVLHGLTPVLVRTIGNLRLVVMEIGGEWQWRVTDTETDRTVQTGTAHGPDEGMRLADASARTAYVVTRNVRSIRLHSRMVKGSLVYRLHLGYANGKAPVYVTREADRVRACLRHFGLTWAQIERAFEVPAGERGPIFNR